MNRISGHKSTVIVLLLLIIISGCKTDSRDKGTGERESRSSVLSLERADDKSAEIVKNAIAYMGGWEQWKSKNNISYTKTIQYLDSLGKELKVVTQQHVYQLHPTFKAAISWKEDGDDLKIINTGRQAWKLKNGAVMEDKESVNYAWNSSFGSHYVMCMPFKLADPGTVLSYEGVDTLPNNKTVHSIKAIYKKGAGSAAGLHTWWYYFNTDNYQPEANFLDYGNGFSYTAYESFQEIGGIKVNKIRNSYNASGKREIEYLSAVYTNKDIRFDEQLSIDQFEVPE